MDILNKSKSLQLIGRISKASGNLRDNIQVALVSGLAHYQDVLDKDGNITRQGGDTVVLTKLQHAVGKFYAKDVHKAICHYANVKWDKNAHNKEGGYIKAAKKGTPAQADVEAAIAVPFFELNKDKPTAALTDELDWRKRTKSLIDAIDKAITNRVDNKEGKKVTEADVKTARNFIVSLENLLADTNLPANVEQGEVDENGIMQAIAEQEEQPQKQSKKKAA